MVETDRRTDKNFAFDLESKWRLISEAESGDIFFSRDRTIISWLIRTITGFNYSHVIVKISPYSIIDAAVGGVAVRDNAALLDSKVSKIEKMPFPKGVDRKKFLSYMVKKLGSYYDYGALLGFLISKIFSMSRWRENITHGASRYFCSELVSKALVYAGAEFGLPPSQMMPKDLYYYLSQTAAIEQ